MAGINNKYDYRDGILNALEVEHTPHDVRNEDEYRKKVLDGFGVEYTDDDINQKNLFREKVVSGLASGGGGGGGGDLSTAEVTFDISTGKQVGIDGITIATVDGIEFLASGEYNVNNNDQIKAVLFKGEGSIVVLPTGISDVTVTGDATVDYDGDYYVDITGDCTITIS